MRQRRIWIGFATLVAFVCVVAADAQAARSEGTPPVVSAAKATASNEAGRTSVASRNSRPHRNRRSGRSRYDLLVPVRRNVELRRTDPDQKRLGGDGLCRSVRG